MELLLLDEPTSGLDPLMEEVFRQVISEVAGEGRTVLLSSHILSEVEALCDQLSIVREGRTVESGTLNDLRHLTRTFVEAEVTEPIEQIAQLAGVHDLEIDGSTVRCQVDTSSLGDVLAVLAASGVRRMVSQPPTLEQLLLRHYDMTAHEQKVANAG